MLFSLDNVEDASFANMAVAQGQLEAVRIVRDILDGSAESGAYLWGDAGCGKTHLLAAAAASKPAAGWLAKIEDSAEGSAPDLVLADDIDKLEESSQQLLLGLLKQAHAGTMRVLCTGAVPARMLALRGDLRSRVEELLAVPIGRLADHELEKALIAYANRRGRVLQPSVAQFLVHNLPRNLNKLIAAMREVDQFAVQANCRLSVGVARSWLDTAAHES